MTAIKIETGRKTYTIQDEAGILAKFALIPTDIKMYERYLEVDKKFAKLRDKYGDADETLETAVKVNREIEKIINYLFGFDANEDLFGKVSALTPVKGNKIFFELVLEAIGNALKPAAEELIKQAEEAEAEADSFIAENE